MTKEHLQQFIDAQNNGKYGDSFSTALEEIKCGSKKGHWIWYIFPQIAGIIPTPSSTSAQFAIQSLSEAKEYLHNTRLRNRLMSITQETRPHLPRLDDLFGLDVIKFKASLTLFLFAAYENRDEEAYILFKQTLSLAFSRSLNGVLHATTLRLLKKESTCPTYLKECQSISQLPEHLSALKPKPSATLDTQAAANKTDDVSCVKKEVVSLDFSAAFQFSRTERFFQWLYNLTHSTKSRYSRIMHQQKLSTNPTQQMPQKGPIWTWLMGLNGLSKRIQGIRTDQEILEKAQSAGQEDRGNSAPLQFGAQLNPKPLIQTPEPRPRPGQTL